MGLATTINSYITNTSTSGKPKHLKLYHTRSSKYDKHKVTLNIQSCNKTNSKICLSPYGYLLHPQQALYYRHITLRIATGCTLDTNIQHMHDKDNATRHIPKASSITHQTKTTIIHHTHSILLQSINIRVKVINWTQQLQIYLHTSTHTKTSHLYKSIKT